MKPLIQRIDENGRLFVPGVLRERNNLTCNDIFEVVADKNGIYFQRQSQLSLNKDAVEAAVKALRTIGFPDVGIYDLKMRGYGKCGAVAMPEETPKTLSQLDHTTGAVQGVPGSNILWAYPLVNKKVLAGYLVGTDPERAAKNLQAIKAIAEMLTSLCKVKI